MWNNARLLRIYYGAHNSLEGPYKHYEMMYFDECSFICGLYFAIHHPMYFKLNDEGTRSSQLSKR